MNKSSHVAGLHHTGLSVTNLDQAIEYYKDVFEFECVGTDSIPDTADNREILRVENASARRALMKSPTGYVELIEFLPVKEHEHAPEVYEAGIRHVCIQAIDVDTLYDTCMDAGATAHARPSGLGTGALYAYIRDPQNNVLELEGVPWGPEDMKVPWYAHTAIVTPDIVRLTAFYEMLTGVDVHDRQSLGPHRAFDKVAGLSDAVFKGAWIQLSNATLEFWQYSNPPTRAKNAVDFSRLGWNHLCFEVDDVHVEYDRLMSEGVEIHSAPSETETGIAFYGRDPDGNIFECLETRQGELAPPLASLEGWEFLVRLEAAIAKNYSRG